MQLNKYLLLASLIFVSHGAFAQAESSMQVKTGDKLTADVLRYGMRGTELYAETTTTVTAKIVVSAEGRIVTYSSGRIEKSDSAHTIIEVKTADGQIQKVPDDRLFRWMPVGNDFASMKKLKETFQASNNCGGGSGTVEYEITPKEIKYKLMISGKETEIKAVELLMNRQWSAGRCGIGKQVRRIVYSPDLDAVLETDYLNYLPNGVLLNRGAGFRLKSVN